MKPTLIDTDILSLFFRNHPVVVNRFAEYAREHRALDLSIITYYEVLSGLPLDDETEKRVNALPAI